MAALFTLGAASGCGGGDEPSGASGDTGMDHEHHEEVDEELSFVASAGVASEHAFDTPRGGEDVDCNLGDEAPAGVSVDDQRESGTGYLLVAVDEPGVYDFSMVCLVITDTPDGGSRRYDVTLTVE